MDSMVGAITYPFSSLIRILAVYLNSSVCTCSPCNIMMVMAQHDILLLITPTRKLKIAYPLLWTPSTSRSFRNTFTLLARVKLVLDILKATLPRAPSFDRARLHWWPYKGHSKPPISFAALILLEMIIYDHLEESLSVPEYPLGSSHCIGMALPGLLAPRRSPQRVYLSVL